MGKDLRIGSLEVEMDAKEILLNLLCVCMQLIFRGGKISPNPFVHLNPLTLIEPKPTQLLIGLNGHQLN